MNIRISYHTPPDRQCLGRQTRTASARARGYALLLVMVFTGLSMIALTSIMQWSSNHSKLSSLNDEFQGGLVAAEGAAEKALATIARDFQQYGEPGVLSRLETYRSQVPTTTENPAWQSYEFTSSAGEVGRMSVDRVSTWQFADLQTKYSGLKGYSATYRVVAEARDLRARSPLKASLRQDIQLASIPIFGFGIFYALDLEVCPWQDFTITGRVHGNANIYCYPNVGEVTFKSHVTAAHHILPRAHPDDPTSRVAGTVTYLADHDSRVAAMSLPLDTNPGSNAFRVLIEAPTAFESSSSLIGQQRFFNKADLIILVSNTTVIATSGAYNGFAVTLPWASLVSAFVRTNVYFFNARESKEVRATEFDVAAFREASKYNTVRSSLGRDPRIVYIADRRTGSSSRQAGVRLVSGQTLPTPGLTIATPNPLYVKGHYNALSSDLGTTNTTHTVPAALISDALTVLSGGWADNLSYTNLSGRAANSTTINAAVLTGIVPTRGGYYSGGVENTLRILENWSDDYLTFNGSFVVLFESQTATAPWGTAGVYNPPLARQFSWDRNFQTAALLPPGTPELRTIIPSDWRISQAFAASPPGETQ